MLLQELGFERKDMEVRIRVLLRSTKECLSKYEGYKGLKVIFIDSSYSTEQNRRDNQLKRNSKAQNTTNTG
jgi:hypothetical protein